MAGVGVRQPGDALTPHFVKSNRPGNNRAFASASTIVICKLPHFHTHNDKRGGSGWWTLDKPESKQIKRVLTGGVTLVAALVVLLLGATVSNGHSPWLVLVEASLIAVTVTAAAGWIWTTAPPVEQVIEHADEPPANIRNMELATTPDYDPLTRTLNQRGIATKLLELMALGDRYGNKLSIAVAGVDHLNDVNNHWGRIVGDHALRLIAEALAETVRMPDRLGRWGDDLFLVVLPETDLQGARRIAERFREAVADVEIEADQRARINMTVSVGITAYRRGDDLRGLLDRAVRAMEAAKHQGRNRVLTDLAA